MTASIMQTKKECFVTGSSGPLHRHHVYGGNRRKLSEQWGCWIWLRSDYHNMSNHGIHFDQALNLQIKRQTQIRFEQLHGREKFMEIFGKNYLEESYENS